MQYEREMSDVVTLLKPLIDKLPWWEQPAFAVLAIIWCVFKGFWEIRKARAEARNAEWELKERTNKAKAEIAALREKERSPPKVSDFPQFTPVSGITWSLSLALAIGNACEFVFLSISEPLTTLKAATMALSLFAAIWSFSTPAFMTLLRNITHAHKVHLWLVEISFKEQFDLVRTMLSSEKETVIQVSKELLSANHEVLVAINKQLDEIKRRDKAEE